MAASVSVVHAVAKTHLDLGFTGLAAEVARRYLDDHLPRALATAAELRGRSGPERLVWTTGSWVLHHALTEGGPALRAAVHEGIEAGDLAWHALPFTTHTELMDAALFRSGLAIAAELDDRFGRTTTAAKMTDVPGHTRSMVPLLAEAGVTFVHIGVNPAWPVPDVPPVFRWRAPDGSEVVVAYGSEGYGGEVVVEGFSEVLALVHTGDNLGPPDPDEVVAAHAELAERFPGAEIRASTLDAFARTLAASGTAASLPEVTAEIGDPWLFGAASDPQKLSAHRMLVDLRANPRVAEALGSHAVSVDRDLLLVAEHTWGLDQKVALPDDTNWSRSALAQLRTRPDTARFEASWAEQRAYVDRADRRLRAHWPPGPSGGGRAGRAGEGPDLIARRGEATRAAVAGWRERIGAGHGVPRMEGRQAVELGSWRLALDPMSGAVCELVHIPTGRVLSDRSHPLGLLRYRSFDERDYERFYGQLTPAPQDEWWARWDNTKPGIEDAGAISATWTAERSGAWFDGSGGRGEVLVRVGFDGPVVGRLGAPPEAWIRWSWTEDAPDELEVELAWADRPANRLPESCWFSFTPAVDHPRYWVMDKMGQPVSPLDVVARGGRSLHAIGRGGLTYIGPDGRLNLTAMDAPLVAPGRPDLLDADPPLPDLAGGWHVLLHDNCWGTNFPMWNEGPARFRFRLVVGSVD